MLVALPRPAEIIGGHQAAPLSASCWFGNWPLMAWSRCQGLPFAKLTALPGEPVRQVYHRQARKGLDEMIPEELLHGHHLPVYSVSACVFNRGGITAVSTPYSNHPGASTTEAAGLFILRGRSYV